MKIFYFYDESETTKKLKDQFEASLPKDIEPYPRMVENNFCQKYHGGGYYGWICKYESILSGLENTKENEYFIFSDIDIKFYSTIIDKINLKYDIYFQRETPSNDDINIGFMIIKNCESVYNFWNYISLRIEELKFMNNNSCYRIYHKRGYGSGQFVVNDILKFYSDLSWDKLCYKFWSQSIGYDYLSTDIIIHHANATNNTKKKLDQLEYINQLIKYYE